MSTDSPKENGTNGMIVCGGREMLVRLRENRLTAAAARDKRAGKARTGRTGRK
ncbi:hypothetical protein KI387_001369, partial [Taxus chinensis]